MADGERMRSQLDAEIEIQAELLDIFQQLDRFINEPKLRSIHLRTPHIVIYIRRSMRAFTLNDRPEVCEPNCLDLADMTVHDDWHGRGIFRSFMLYASLVSPYRFLLLECVHNPILADYAERHGWTRFDVNCYWRERCP